MDEPNNIRAIRKQKGLTLQQLAALTKHPKPGQEPDLSTIQKLEKGRRKLTSEWRAVIAEALGVPESDLTDVLDQARPIKRVPLIGEITAGNWREAVEDATGLIPTTKGGPNTFALVPVGDSMDRIVPPGNIIFVDPDDRELVDKKFYAMMRLGGDTTFKQFRVSPMRLEPCSNNPEHKTIMMGDEPFVTIGRIVGSEIDL